MKVDTTAITFICFGTFASMPNNYFQFKQFTIQQENCTMKVCTDVCLFGAYAANEIKDKPISRILDIGTGTGLLALMIAQKNHAHIDAIEIDTSAYEQARHNISLSTWNAKISVMNACINNFVSADQYDMIISNPPFYEGDLKSDKNNKNAAKHDSTLTLKELLQAVKKHLSATGLFTVLLPYHRLDYFIDEARKINLHLTKKMVVKQRTGSNYFRGILFFSNTASIAYSEEIAVKNQLGLYTEKFTELLKDYYLYL
jgi:tRNA1Val (adenine37-N6)-methyltransferase